MKNFLFVLITLFVLAGCQKPEGQQVPDMDQRKDIGHKLILKSLNDLQNKDLKSTIIDLQTSIKIDLKNQSPNAVAYQIGLAISHFIKSHSS